MWFVEERNAAQAAADRGKKYQPRDDPSEVRLADPDVPEDGDAGAERVAAAPARATGRVDKAGRQMSG